MPAYNTMRAKRKDPELWEAVKTMVMMSQPGPWSARKAQQAVQESKRQGGRYVGPKKADNSLSKWTAEDWGYVNGDSTGRYLPKTVREQLTPAQRRATNRRKAKGTAQGKKRVPYSPATAQLMRLAGVF